MTDIFMLLEARPALQSTKIRLQALSLSGAQSTSQANNRSWVRIGLGLLHRSFQRQDLQLLHRQAASPQSPQATGPARSALLCSKANLQVEAPSDTRQRSKCQSLLGPRWRLEGRVQVS